MGAILRSQDTRKSDRMPGPLGCINFMVRVLNRLVAGSPIISNVAKLYLSYQQVSNSFLVHGLASRDPVGNVPGQ